MNSAPFSSRIFFRRMVLCCLTAVFFMSCKNRSEQSTAHRPNIIFVLVDDLGRQDVGFMGSKLYQTPHIDRLAAEGMVFTQAYAACAVCSPTRASIMTGKYPARLGITDWIRGQASGVKIPPDRKNPTGYDTLPGYSLLTPRNPFWMESEEITLAEALKSVGYTTCHVGKWHLGPEGWQPENQGFDFNYGGTDLGQPPVYFDPYEAGGLSIENLSGKKEGQYLSEREGDEATRFIRENHTKGPFFLNLWHYAVHTPLEAKKDVSEKYKTRQVEDPFLPDYRPEDVYTEHFRTKMPLDSQRNPVYAAMIESVDDVMGRLLHTLDSLQIRDNTMIIFFSDNGGHIVSTSNHPLRLGKGYPYEGGIREPMIINWPEKIKAGSRNHTPVISNDFFPTICNIAGATVTQNDGIDLTPIFTETSTLPRENLFWHFPHYWWGDQVKPYSIVRAGEWKLIKWYEGPEYELYNLHQDLSETQNLAHDLPEKVTELDHLLENWLNEVGAKKPVPTQNHSL
ncbi:MAG: sulfatase [Bacteroidia bacterium]|nr:sulfatase [Bacteroidia bacterium]